MTPNDTAKKVLEGTLLPSEMPFSMFRSRIIAEHPEYLDDDQIHDLYMHHVVTPAILDAPPRSWASPPVSKDADLLDEIAQIVQEADASRATVEEVREVAAKRAPSAKRKQSFAERALSKMSKRAKKKSRRRRSR